MSIRQLIEARDPVDLRDETVETVNLEGLELREPVDLTGAHVKRLTLKNTRGLSHLLVDGEDSRTTIDRLVVIGCDAPTDSLHFVAADIGSTVVRRTRLRSLRLQECVLGPVELDDVDVGVLEVLGCGWSTFEAVQLSVGARLSVAGLGAKLRLGHGSVGGFTSIETTSALDAFQCTFAGPFQATWVGPWVFDELPDDDPRRAAEPPRPEHETVLSLRSVRFGSAAHLRWGRGRVVLDGTVFTDASTLERAADATERPRLESVTGLDGEELRIADVRIADCPLAPAASLGAIDPDQLRLGFGAVGWTRRRYLCDERTPEQDGKGWKQRRRRHESLDAGRLAATYRELRISCEAAGNHSGANDLHYGERLWQRKATRVRSPDWLWLAAYGLVGYGVRPWRPLALLIALVLAGGLALSGTGLQQQRVLGGEPEEKAAEICSRAEKPGTPEQRQTVLCDVGFGGAIEFAARSTTGLVRPPTGFEAHGTAAWIEIATRLLAALLFGLFVLAIRNRVRR